MLVKIRCVCNGIFFKYKVTLFLLSAVLIGYTYFTIFTGLFPNGSLWEFLIFILSNMYIILTMLTFMVLIITSENDDETNRYPILVRYKSREHYLTLKILSKLLLTVTYFIYFIAIIIFIGIAAKLPLQTAGEYISATQFGSLALKLSLNIISYLLFMIMLHEVLHSIICNNVVDIIITMCIPLLNIMITKLQIRWLILCTPWGNITYILSGSERLGYQFYWWYWLLLLAVTAYIAETLYERKDFVYDKDRKNT